MSNHLLQRAFCLITIISFLFPSNSSTASTTGFQDIQAEQIKVVIELYFDGKYKSFSELSLDKFFENYADVKNDKVIDEQTKLRLEMRHSQLYNLRYEQYSFNIEYKSIEISEKTAVVYLEESHEVVFPVFSPEKSYMKGLSHKIILHKDLSTWKISEDVYQDYVWNFLLQTELSLEDIENKMLATAKQKEINPSDLDSQYSTNQPSSSYYRDGAKWYAYDYWDEWNPSYYPFEADCTNFVSQALYVGGHIPMTPPQSGVGTSCWFWTNINNRAAAWVGTPNLFQFIINNESIYCSNKGPTGYEVYGPSNLAIGDLIFFDWGDGGYNQDHVGIVVTWSASSPGVATHTENHYNYPYLSFDFVGSDFVHISN